MRALGVAALFILLGGSVYYAWALWTRYDTGSMPTELYVALVIGVVFSLIIGCGLMALVFYSSRRGYDERASGGDQSGE